MQWGWKEMWKVFEAVKSLPPWGEGGPLAVDEG